MKEITMDQYRRARPVAPVLIVVVGIVFGAFADGMPAHSIDTAAMARSVRPEEDFYRFANGQWLATTEIPPDRAQVDSFTLVIDRTRRVIGQILEQAARETGVTPDSVANKVGTLYRSGMDVNRIEAAGARPLEPFLKQIAAIQRRDELLPALALLHNYEVFAGFHFATVPDLKNSSRMIAELSQGGLALPDRDYYLKQDEKGQALLSTYLTHLGKMFELLGDKPAAAATKAGIALAFETRLARASRARVDLRDPDQNYHVVNVTEPEKGNGGSWKAYFACRGLQLPKRMNIAQPMFVQELNRMLADEPLDNWKAYLRWQVAHAYAEFLNSPFEGEDFHFFGTVLHGVTEMRPRSDRVQAAVDDLLGEGLGQLYVARVFTPDTLTRAASLVASVKAALRERLEHLDWMSPSTSREALRKLDTMQVKLGHPEKWHDYAELSLNRLVYAENVLAARAYQTRKQLAKIDRPVDRDEWEVTPQTVNAYYKESRNEIVLPAAIWQPPFFDSQADDAVNYGAIGMIIGHEMTHGFDDRGRRFDASGNLRDWWAPYDAEVYRERSARLEKQFDSYVAIDDLHVNGRLTLGENIADLGGLTISYLALEKALSKTRVRAKIDGFTAEQRFFLAFAQLWRAKLRPEFMRFKIQTSDHTQGRYRVLGALANTPEFFDAFGISRKVSVAWRNPDPVRIW
jgi:predicted metalloendopeptidase